jgi:hypothetical protein
MKLKMKKKKEPCKQGVKDNEETTKGFET